jgi:hypothetical protein
MYPSMPAEAQPYAPAAPSQQVDQSNQYHTQSSAPPLNYGSPPQPENIRSGTIASEQAQPLMANQASAAAHDNGRQPSQVQSYQTSGSPPQAHYSAYPPIAQQESAQYPSQPSQPPSNTIYQTIPQQDTNQQYAAPTFPAFPDAPTQIMQPPAASSPELPKEALLIEL